MKVTYQKTLYQRYIAALIVMISMVGTNAFAKDIEPQQVKSIDSTKPVLQITPYIWATGLHGYVSPFKRAPRIKVEKTFHEILEDINFGGFVNIWARRDRFVFSSDIMYVRVNETKTIGTLPPLPIAVPPGTTLSGSVNSTQFTASLQGGYRVYDGKDVTFDALAGANFWHISNDVTLRAGSLVRGYGERFNWVDPIIGGRVFVQTTDKISFQGQAYIGGFGAGSDFTWSALATANYALNPSVSFSAGYKILEVDYSKGGHEYDVRLQGPVLGATWKF